MPEGRHLPHVQPQRDADALFPHPRHRGKALHVFLLKAVNIQLIADRFFGHRPFAAVPANIFCPVGKSIHRQTAVVLTQAAGNGAHLVGKALQRLPAQKRTPLPRRSHGLGVQRTAVRPHQPGNGRPHHVGAKLSLKGPQNRIVQKGAALHHNVLPQILQA